ncbi:hypothetical protein ACGFOU_01935 [Streptomyces sp. NPDC048595]|uniref:hypothetical protein n=1 Tax=Streptomyces sp. NPDC048595 TaxID=3365576 RepID=UPI0037140070
MSTPVMNDLAAPMRALRLLAADFPELPAVNVNVCTFAPDQLELVSHDNLGAFEAWREAAGILPESVTYKEQSEGRTRVLCASTDYAGVHLRLVGFSDIPGHDGGEPL